MTLVRKFQFLNLAAAWVCVFAGGSLLAEELTEDSFTTVRKLIEPQEGEGLWRHIPWETDLTTARRRAAAEGKPLLIWAGGGSAPLGGC